MRHYSLRGNAADERFLAACETALGARPPLRTNSVHRDILWLGPDEWLVIADVDIGTVRRALQGLHTAVVDVTSSRVEIEVAGPDAEETLSKAATLDFDLRAFPVGACAQTNIARTQGIIRRTAPHRFVIYVRTSFARYLQSWLGDARA
ncbi:MAG: sarcosine oxidase subunit gamma [Betaproteobacteria bacterium]